MHRFTCSVAARVGIALALSLPLAAHAWTQPVPTTARVALDVTDASGNDNGQYWAVGATVDTTALLHYANGTEATASAWRRGGFVGAKLTTPQGELIALQYSGLIGARCRLVKYGTNGAVRWDFEPLGTLCGVGKPANMNLWLANDGHVVVSLAHRILRVGADGRVLAGIDAATPVAAVDPRNGALYSDTGNVAGATPTVVAYDRQGARLWGTVLDGSARVSVAPDGSLRAVGIKRDGGLFVSAIAASGAITWTTLVDPATPAGAYDALKAPSVDADGATLIAAAGSADAAVKLDASGRVQWRATRAALGIDANVPVRDARIVRGGDFVLTHGDRLSRLDATGAKRYSRALALPAGATQIDIVGFDADGASVLHLVGEQAQERHGKLARVSTGGADLPAPNTDGVLEQPMTARRVVLADGSIVAWSSSRDGVRELARYGTDGRVVWRKETPGAWVASFEPTGTLVAGDGRVCLLGALTRDGARIDQVLTCHRIDDGSVAWTRKLLERGEGWTDEKAGRLHMTADGSIAAWYAVGAVDATNNPLRTIGYARVDRNGGVQATKTLEPDAQLVATSPADGPFTLVKSGSDAIVFNADGSERRRIASGASDTSVAAFDANGGFVAISSLQTSPPSGKAQRYDASGAAGWSHPFQGEASAMTAPLIVGDAVYLATCCTDPAAPHSIMRLSLANGTMIWQRRLAPLSNTAPAPRALVATAAGDAIAAVGTSFATIDIDVLNPQDGGERARRREACRSDSCYTEQPLIAGNILHAIDLGYYGASSLIAWPIPAAQNALVRIDQVGLTGGWWSPYANGEGLVVDYLPASRTFFAPWFTFSRDGGNDPAGQRWYVVQGTVPANATSVELPITESTGGVFDAGPTVQARIVGTATLSFTDCNNGTMRYRFDAGTNDAATGTITLSRLTPATQNCVLADGTTQTHGSTPAGGFDARLSGSWFEPATSGQGLQFVVQPGGVFFAPWFTFDPAGPSDDPGRQRWFTLQGSLADVRNGVVEAPIVQTVGGAFDRVPTNNMNIVGKATVTFTACDRARVDYRYDDNDLAGAMRTLAGSIDLTKIGGCTQ